MVNNFRKSGQDASYGGVSYRPLEATDWERTRQSHVCSPHFVYLDFINDVEYYGLRKETSLQQDCCPNFFSIKTRSRCRNAHSVNRWTPRLSLAGPGSERRTPQVNKSS